MPGTGRRSTRSAAPNDSTETTASSSEPGCLRRAAIAGRDGTLGHIHSPRGLREVARARQRLPDRRATRASVRADAGADRRDLRAAHRVSARTESCSCQSPARATRSRGCRSSTPTARRRSCQETARARRCCTCAAVAGPTATRSGSRRPPARFARRSPRRPRAPSKWAGHACGARTFRRATTAESQRSPPPVANGVSSTCRSATPSARSRSMPKPSSTRSISGRSARRSSTTSCFPNRTNVSWFTARDAEHDPRADLRARSRGDVGERDGGERRRGRARDQRRFLAGHRQPRWRRARRSRSTPICTSR